MNPWLVNGISLVAGCLVGLGFPPFDQWWTVLVGVAAFILVALGSTPGAGLLRGYIFGFGFNIVAFHWIAVVGVPVLIVFMAWLAVWYAVVGLAVSLTRRTPAWGLIGVGVWMAVEWLCARWPLGGFGWGRLAYAFSDTTVNGLFPLLSVSGVFCLVVTGGFVIAWLVRPLLAGKPSWHSLNPRPVAALLALVVLGTAGGLAGRAYSPAATASTVTVAVVQGNVPGRGIDALGPEYTVENNHLAETIILAAEIRTGLVAQPDFVVWPENSTATDPFTNQKTAGIIHQALDLVGVPVFVGSIVLNADQTERQTVGLWWTDAGVTASYAKRNLVPFGEWVPAKAVMDKLIPALNYVGAQSIPGKTVGVLDVAAAGSPLRVGDLICFEVAYDSTVDQMLTGDQTTGGGAQVVVVQTSNAMFTGSDQMANQDRITRVRAMEARREILVATTNSLAGLIDSQGHIVYQAQLSTSDTQVFTVPLRTALTPAIAYRLWYDLATIFLPLLVGAVLIIRRPRATP